MTGSPPDSSRDLTDSGALGDKVRAPDPATVSLDAANETSAVPTPREVLHQADREQARKVQAVRCEAERIEAPKRRRMAIALLGLVVLTLVGVAAAVLVPLNYPG